jgi:hypothetical protein
MSTGPDHPGAGQLGRGDSVDELDRDHLLARTRLELADDAALVRLARLVVSGVASVAGLGLDASEQCRSAIDEMCSSLLEVSQPGSVLSLVIETDGEQLRVEGSMPRSAHKELEPVRTQLSQMILDSTVERYQLRTDTDPATFWFGKAVDTWIDEDG